MKAMVYREYGSPDVLSLTEMPIPMPADDEVLVRVHASSVNDYDYHLLTGHPFLNRIGAPFKPRNPVLGSDVAGVVESVGKDVTQFQIGDEVFGDVSPCGFGAFAEYVCARENALALKPPVLTFEQAAAVPQAGGLATVAVYRGRPLRPGRRVLINGAGGGVGTFAVQIAKAHGCDVTAVDRASKLDVLLSVGADHVIDYLTQDYSRTGQTYDLMVDIAMHRPLSANRRALAPGGQCSVTGGSIPRVLLVLAAGPMLSSFRDTTIRLPLWRPNNKEDTAFLTGLIDQGSVMPVVDSVFPLSDLPEAFRRFAAQAHTGKIVITV